MELPIDHCYSCEYINIGASSTRQLKTAVMCVCFQRSATLSIFSGNACVTMQITSLMPKIPRLPYCAIHTLTVGAYNVTLQFY